MTCVEKCRSQPWYCFAYCFQEYPFKITLIEMLCDCVPVVTYVSRTRPQETGSKVFQHQPCLFDSRQNLLLHLVLPISHFIYSFRFWHLLQITLQSTGQPHASPSRMQHPSSLFTPQPLAGIATAAGRHSWGLEPVLQA